MCIRDREHTAEYTDDMFIELGMEINSLSHAKNIVMKWGIYSIHDRGISVEQMCDRALSLIHIYFGGIMNLQVLISRL